jgi:hypothetical protein
MDLHGWQQSWPPRVHISIQTFFRKKSVSICVIPAFADRVPPKALAVAQPATRRQAWLKKIFKARLRAA